ncbi:MAG: hypothetical protein EU533_07110 [Promethearchaeota archaeon]|nr:MAG: hypothetical protein EU533_07110 [Candidatus Lokiarchaeota archaeon]
MVLGPLEYTALVLWIISIIFLAIAGTLFMRDYKKSENIFFFWISLFFFLFILSRILRITVKFYIGEPPAGEPLTGDAFILESIYTIVSYIGLFCVYFALEKTLVKKSHFFFSIVVWVTCILSIIDFITRTLLWLTLPFFILTVLGLPVIFLYLAAKSSGEVRRNSLLVAIGVIMFIFGIAFDIPDGKPIFIVLGDVFLAIVPPILQILAVIILRKGFQTKM